jgi:hypothetical protein
MSALEYQPDPSPSRSNWLFAPGVLTPRLIIVAFWMMSSMATFRTRDMSDLLGESAVDAQVLFQMASWGAFAALAGYFVYVRRFDFNLVRGGPILWYCLFLAFAGFSVVYSSSPALTFYYVVQLATIVILVCSLGERLDAFYKLVIFYAALNWILLVLGETGLNLGLEWITTAQRSFMGYGGTEEEHWRFSTAYAHPTQLSIVCAMAAIGLASRREHWRCKNLTIVFLVLTVMLSFSRSAIAGMLAGFIVIFLLRGVLSVVLGLISLGTVAAMALPGVQDIVLDTFTRGQSAEDFGSLTGRANIYDSAWMRIHDRDFNWLLGEGFRSLRFHPIITDDYGHGVGHAHSLFLTVYIELGVTGVICATMVLLSFSFYALRLAFPSRISRHENISGNPEILVMVFPILAMSIMDSGFVMSADIFVIGFIFICAQARYEYLRIANLDNSNNRNLS